MRMEFDLTEPMDLEELLKILGKAAYALNDLMGLKVHIETMDDYARMVLVVCGEKKNEVD